MPRIYDGNNKSMIKGYFKFLHICRIIQSQVKEQGPRSGKWLIADIEMALFIMGKMRIGDEALEKDSDLSGILGCVAYFSLANAIGLEANSRGEFLSPRVFSALAAALIFDFVIAELTNQV